MELMITGNLNVMKKIKFIVAAAALACTGCYDDYVKDFEHTGIYMPYQYDLRTFVVGEGMRFDVGVVLGGTSANGRDRSVRYAVEPALVTGNLASLLGSDDEELEPFTAFGVMSGASASGSVSQSYVTDAVKASGISDLTPLPAEYFSLSDPERMVVRSGRHTATVTVKADERFLADPHASSLPYYALAFRIAEADADVVPLEKSFAVIAVRYENMLFGNYWHGGVTTVKNDATGEVVEKNEYPLEIPHDDSRVYTLTTVAPDALTTSRLGDWEGSLRLTLRDDGRLDVASADGRYVIEPFGDGCYFNCAKRLQDRRLFLNYKFANGDGTTTYIEDVLVFRNRVRDGVNEWQDENPENYK